VNLIALRRRVAGGVARDPISTSGSHTAIVFLLSDSKQISVDAPKGLSGNPPKINETRPASSGTPAVWSLLLVLTHVG